MNKIPYFLIISAFILFAACGGSGDDSSGEATEAMEEATSEAAEQESATVADDNLAICLWPVAGLRDKPGMNTGGKYLASINLGEIVTLTGNTEEVAEEKRTYLEMTLSDGKTGWCNEYLFAVNAQRGVALGEIDIYKRPDLTTYDGKKLERGEIIAVMESDKEGWVEVVGKERKKAGWIQASSIDGNLVSTDEIDVTVAIMLEKAMAEKTPPSRLESLENIADNNTFKQSSLISVVEEAISNLSARAQLRADQLFITADVLNVRSAPDTEADNVLFKVNEGDICNIIEKGSKVAIREMNDYWYKIEIDGQEGWVYGHYTSKKLAD